jgi:diguanylate cyclase (GGDEF)-like protein/PAS domain S-box-containing protein
MQEPTTARSRTTGTTRSSPLAARLGLNSIRGRNLYVSALFSALLLIAALVAQNHVGTAASATSGNLTNRYAVNDLIRDLNNDIWLTENNLQRYMLQPEEPLRIETLGLLDHIRADIEDIPRQPWGSQAPEALENIRSLSVALGKLRSEIDRLMIIRVEPNQLYPAIPIISEVLVPAHTEFYNAATLAMDDADLLSDIPAQQQVHRTFSETRHAWSMMILAFRSYMSFRSGLFPGDWRDGTHQQLQHVDEYYATVSRLMDQLSEMEKQGVLEFQQSDSLAGMRTQKKKWRSAYEKAILVHNSTAWRADAPLLKESIQPLFLQIWTTLRGLEKNLLAESAGDMAQMTRIANGLSNILWLVFAIVIAMTMAFYLLIEHTARRPMARVALALKAEAHGSSHITLPATGTIETQDLVDAFDHMRQQVHSRQQRLETILGNAAEGIVTFDATGSIESLNTAAVRLFGYTEHEAVGADISLLIPPPETHDMCDGYMEHFMRGDIQRLVGHEGEVTGRHKDGARFPMALKVSEIELEGKPLYTGLVSDISERKAVVEHLKFIAEHDGLTGLFNRSYFQTELEHAVERIKRDGQTYALLYIDLDNFKYVNDTLGHAAGDHLLIEIAAILNKRARKSDLTARLGGDEFTVLLHDVNIEQAVLVADSFRLALADYVFKHGSEPVDIGCSIGVAMVTYATQSSAQALSHADIACHLAKRGGRNRVHLFRSADESSVSAMSLDMGWSRRIKETIENGRFALACQPIVDTRTHEIESYEVLIRMLDDNNEIILPGGFMPSAERFGLAVEIDKWVIVNAIETLVEQRKTLARLRYSINLSGQTLSDHSVCDLILDTLTQSGLDPAALTFEVTETVAIADMALAEDFLGQLQKIGCRTALDDFGSGLSSFAYLRDLPVDSVKIDGRFVKSLAENPVDQAMVKAMNDIAHALGKKTVAEFVENHECFELLKELGVDYAQGYHLGRPDIVTPCKAISEHTGNAVVCLLSPSPRALTGPRQ